MSRIICLSTEDLKQLLDFTNVMDAVRQSYIAHSLRTANTFPIIRESLQPGATFGVKSGYMPEDKILGLKAAGYWTQNRSKGDEAHQATVILVDPDSGKPQAFLDGNYITTIRTGAAGAVAADTFAKRNARHLAVLGTGVQGKIQAEGIMLVRPEVEEIRIWGHSGASTASFVEQFRDRIRVTVCSTVSEAVRDAHIVVTATPSTQPLVLLEDLSPGVHINAMGADTKGKSEIHPSVISIAEVFVDDETQSRSIGELQGQQQKVCKEIGLILAGKQPSRTSSDSITLFDSTGIALQDLKTAALALKLAQLQQVGTYLDWS